MNTLHQQLEELCAGLLYTSETDAPLEPVCGTLSVPHHKFTSFDEFFDQVDEMLLHNEMTAERERWQALREFIVQHSVRQYVCRVAKSDCEFLLYVVGEMKYGGVVGFKTEAVET
jgi:hypothetical protein